MRRSLVMLAMAVVLLISTGCQSPEVKLESALLKNITTSRLDVGLNLNVFNPNSYSLPLQTVDWDLDLFRSDFTSGQTNFTRNIGANARADVEVPLGISYNAVQLGVQGILTRRSIPWGFAGSCSFRTPGGPIRIGFAKDGTWKNPLL